MQVKLEDYELHHMLSIGCSYYAMWVRVPPSAEVDVAELVYARVLKTCLYTPRLTHENIGISCSYLPGIRTTLLMYDFTTRLYYRTVAELVDATDLRSVAGAYEFESHRFDKLLHFL